MKLYKNVTSKVMIKLKSWHFCPHLSPSGANWVKKGLSTRLNLQFDLIYNSKFENCVNFFSLVHFLLNQNGGNIKSKAKLNYQIKNSFNFSRWERCAEYIPSNAYINRSLHWGSKEESVYANAKMIKFKVHNASILRWNR